MVAQSLTKAVDKPNFFLIHVQFRQAQPIPGSNCLSTIIIILRLTIQPSRLILFSIDQYCLLTSCLDILSNSSPKSKVQTSVLGLGVRGVQNVKIFDMKLALWFFPFHYPSGVTTKNFSHLPYVECLPLGDPITKRLHQREIHEK